MSSDFGHTSSLKIVVALTKGGVGEGGQVSARDAMRIAAALAGFRMSLVSTSWTISHLASTKPLLSLCRDTISDTVGSFQSNSAFAGKKALTMPKSACGQGHKSPHSGSKKLITNE